MEIRNVIMKVTYRPQLEDGTKLKAIPGFTEGKEYSVFKEIQLEPCENDSDWYSWNAIGNMKRTSYQLADDQGNIRHVDQHYFWHREVLVELPEISHIAACAMPNIRKGSSDCEGQIYAPVTSLHPDDVNHEMVETKIDLRKSHARVAENSELHWSGIGKLRTPRDMTLQQLDEEDANQGLAELKVLCGISAKTTSFEKIEEMMKEMQQHMGKASDLMKEMEFEIRLLKKMAVSK